MRRDWLLLDIKLSANKETLRHEETSDERRQASSGTQPMAEEIWVIVQARSHLLAETLHRKMPVMLQGRKWCPEPVAKQTYWRYTKSVRVVSRRLLACWVHTNPSFPIIIRHFVPCKSEGGLHMCLFWGGALVGPGLLLARRLHVLGHL